MIKTTLAALGLLVATVSTASDDFLSIQFSKKNQVKTGLTWIQQKPKLINHARSKGKRMEALQNDNLSEPSKHDLANREPYTQIGKLFFTLGDRPGQISNCTAAFAGSGRTLITAAHCVMSASGEWNDDFLFVRAYGSKEQEIYAVECIGLLESWGSVLSDSVLTFDYAFLQTSRVSRTGQLPLSTNSPPRQMRIVGYSDNHLNGRRMLELEIRSTIEDTMLSYNDNPLGQGSSGSPWLSADPAKVFSVTSHYKKEDHEKMLGPRLTNDAMRLFTFTQNGCD